MQSTPTIAQNSTKKRAAACPASLPQLTTPTLALGCLTALLLFALAPLLHAQSGTPFVYPLTLTPDYYPTYNDAIGASVLVRDENTDAPLTGTVNFTVDGGAAIPATLNSSGLAYANLGQLSIATHTVTATYLGNAQYSGGSISGMIKISDLPLYFVGTQGTTLFSSGVVFDAEGVAVDAEDNLYVSDKSSAKIYKEDTLGSVTNIPVTGLKIPVGMALDAAGNLYIADTGNNQIVEYSASGVQTVVPTTKLSAPTYLAYDRKNDILYIADTGNNRVESYTPSTRASADVVTGLTALRGVSVDTQGNVYFSDGNAGFLQINTFFGLSNLQIPIYAPVIETGSIAAGVFPYVILTDLAGNGVFRYNNETGEPYQGSQVQINNGANPIVDVAADSTGRVYLAVGNRVDVVDTGSGRAPDVGVNPPKGAANSFFSLIFQTPQAKPGFTVTGTPAKTFNNFGSVTCTGTAGDCFAQGDFVPQFAGVNTGSISVTTTYDIGDVAVWGKGLGGGAAFTPGKISQSSSGATTIGGVAFDSAGNRYVTDTTNNTVTEFSPSGTKTALGFTGLSKPTQIVVDGLGAVYVLDSGNQRIVRLGADGVQSDEYDASDEADFASITAFNLDGDNNLLLAGLPGSPDDEARKKAQVIRKHSASTGAYIVGLEGHFFPPDGKKVDITYPFEHTELIQANLPEVTGVAVDAEENIFAVDSSGTLTRFGIDGTTKQLATGLGSPVGVALDASGTAYVVESNAPLVTLIHPDGSKSPIPVNGLYAPAAFALDGYGDILLGDGPDKQLIFLDRTQQNYVFGDVNVGQSETINGSIGNIGNQPFTISAALPANGNFAQTGTSGACASPEGSTPGTTIAPGGDCDLDYTFNPPADGPFTLSGTLATSPQTLVGSDGGGAINLSGTGEGASSAAPNPVLTPATIDFGSLTVGVTRAPQTATLQNAGTAALPISSFGFFGSNPGLFSESNTCGSNLAAGASCSIAITCAPASAGSFSASLGANFPSPIAQQTIALTCSATPAATPQASLTPSTLNFGSIEVGASSTAQSATLTSTGNAALMISSISVTGTNSGAFASTNNCGTSLAVGASCSISIVFSPTAAGTDSATLSVIDNAAGSPQTSALTGIATAPPPAPDFALTATPPNQSVISGSGAVYQVTVAPVNGSFTNTVDLTASGLPTGATVTFSPVSVIPGSSTATSAMTVQTGTQQAASTHPSSRWRVPAGLISMAVLLLPFRRKRKLLSSLGCLLVLLVMGGALSSCGGGFALPHTNTAPNTYTVTVTGTSGSLQHSTSVQLTVR